MTEDKNKQMATAVVLAQHGNKNAYRDIYISYCRSIYFICFEMTGKPAEAMKLTEEIFIKMFGSVDKLEDHMAFHKWFCSLAVNMCKTYVAESDPVDIASDETTVQLVKKACASASNGDRAEFESTVIKVIEKLIEGLPGNAKTMFFYNYFAGIDDEQIALLEKIDAEEVVLRKEAIEKYLQMQADAVKELGLDITGFIGNMENTLERIASKQFVPSSVHEAVSAAVGTDVNPFAPSPKDKEEMEEAAKEEIRSSGEGDTEQKKSRFSKGDIILFVVILVASLLIFTTVKYIDSNKKSSSSAESKPKTTAEQPDRALVVWNGARDTSFDGGDGTEDSPYLIATGGQLAYFAELVNNGPAAYSFASYLVTSDIILNDTENFRSWGKQAPANKWDPIGFSSGDSGKSFMGSFDGGGHTISGLYVKDDMPNCGLFGVVKNGKIQNVYIKESYVSGGDCTGGIVGYFSTDTDSAAILRCSFSGIVESDGDNAGGIAGYIRTEGEKAKTEIKSCCTSGTVTASKYVGGLVGVSEASDGSILIENCFNTSTVNATDTAGGLVGVQRVAKGSASTSYCYNAGKINAISGAAAIIGELSCVRGTGISGTMACYWLDTTASVSANKGSGEDARLIIGSGTALTDEQMKNRTQFADFNFGLDWQRKDGEYPYPILCFVEFNYLPLDEEEST